MLVSENMQVKLAEQIVNELYSSNMYLSLSSMFLREGLHELSKLFRTFATEERDHALKFVTYMEEREAPVKIGEIASPPNDFPTVLAGLEAAYEHEKKVSNQIFAIYNLADEENDKSTQVFLDWFIEEQVEEVHKTWKLKKAAQMAGPNLLMVEAYLVHIGELD